MPNDFLMCAHLLYWLGWAGLAHVFSGKWIIRIGFPSCWKIFCFSLLLFISMMNVVWRKQHTERHKWWEKKSARKTKHSFNFLKLNFFFFLMALFGNANLYGRDYWISCDFQRDFHTHPHTPTHISIWQDRDVWMWQFKQTAYKYGTSLIWAKPSFFKNISYITYSK